MGVSQVVKSKDMEQSEKSIKLSPSRTTIAELVSEEHSFMITILTS